MPICCESEVAWSEYVKPASYLELDCKSAGC